MVKAYLSLVWIYCIHPAEKTRTQNALNTQLVIDIIIDIAKNIIEFKT